MGYEMEWQPIETAPTSPGRGDDDGTIYRDDQLYYQFNEDMGHWVNIGYWSNSFNSRRYVGQPGWAEGVEFNPTHWMPLPSPPTV